MFIDKSLQAFMEEMDKRDRTKGLPDQYVMAGRVCIILRGLGRLLNVSPIRIAEEWKPFAEKAIRELKEEEATA